MMDEESFPAWFLLICVCLFFFPTPWVLKASLTDGFIQDILEIGRDITIVLTKMMVVDVNQKDECTAKNDISDLETWSFLSCK